MENCKRRRGISLSHHFIYNDATNIVESRVKRVDLLNYPPHIVNHINLQSKSAYKPNVTFSFASPSPQNSQPRWSFQPSCQRTSIDTSHTKNLSIQDNTIDTSLPYSSALNETRDRSSRSDVKKVIFGQKLFKAFPINQVKKEEADKRQIKLNQIIANKQTKVSNFSEKKPEKIQIYNKIIDLPIQKQQQPNKFTNIQLDNILQANQIKKSIRNTKRLKRSEDLITLKQMQKKLKQIIFVCNKH